MSTGKEAKKGNKQGNSYIKPILQRIRAGKIENFELQRRPFQFVEALFRNDFAGTYAFHRWESIVQRRGRLLSRLRFWA